MTQPQDLSLFKDFYKFELDQLPEGGRVSSFGAAFLVKNPETPFIRRFPELITSVRSRGVSYVWALSSGVSKNAVSRFTNALNKLSENQKDDIGLVIKVPASHRGDTALMQMNCIGDVADSEALPEVWENSDAVKFLGRQPDPKNLDIDLRVSFTAFSAAPDQVSFIVARRLLEDDCNLSSEVYSMPLDDPDDGFKSRFLSILWGEANHDIQHHTPRQLLKNGVPEGLRLV